VSETLEAPDPKAVARDLYVDSGTWDAPEGLRQTAAALAVPVRQRPTTTTPEAPANPWDSDPLFQQAHAIISPGEGAHGDPNAKNPYSSASGLDQVIESTFVSTFKKWHPNEAAGKTNAEIWALVRTKDSQGRNYSEVVGAENAHDNAKQMQAAGVPVTPLTIAAAHRLGGGGAIAALKANQTDPNTPLSRVAPDVMSRGNEDVANLTVGQFLANPYPGRRGGAGGQPPSGGDPEAWYRIQQNHQRAETMLNDLMKTSNEDRDRIRALARDYKPFHPEPPPPQPDNDPLQAFGGVASIFVALAAGLSKTPAIAMMNGMAGIIDGAREKDWTKYQQSYKAWKDNTTYALDAHKQYSDDIKDAMEMMTKDANLGNALLQRALAMGDDYEAQMQAWRMNPLEFQHKLDLADKAHIEVERARAGADREFKLRAANGTRDAAREQLQVAQAEGDPAKIAEAEAGVKRANDVVQTILGDIESEKRASMGGYPRGAGKSDNAQAIALRRFMDENPKATAQEIQDFIVAFKEDAPGVATRKNRDQDRKDREEERKEAHDADWKTLNQDKTKSAAQIAQDRLKAAADWHAQQADLKIQAMQLTDDRQKEAARHNEHLEQISADRLITTTERDRLKAEEDHRWHDLQDKRGWGGITSRETTADKQIASRDRNASRRDELTATHNKRRDEIAANAQLSSQQKAEAQRAETERHNRATEGLGEGRLTLGNRVSDIHEDYQTRKLALDSDRSISANERELRRQEERERHDKAIESAMAARLVKAPTAAASKERDAEILAESTFTEQEHRGPTDSTEDQQKMAKLRVDARRSAANEVISDENADFTADRVLAGDERATVGMARSSANITKVTNHLVMRAKEQGISGRELAVRIAEFAGTMAGERTLGVRSANMEVAAKEVEQFAPLAVQRSKAVDRTEYPDLNSILLSAERRTGSPEVVLFGQAVNSMIYVYAKFLNPTGVLTDSDKAAAKSILDIAWSEGQFDATVKQIMTEITFGQKAVTGVRQEFRQGFGGAIGAGTPEGQTPPPSGPTVPRVSNDAEFNALPSGTQFIGPDGQTRRKP
jgi:hypothetical protein